ncbi:MULTISPECIES: phage tail protein [unclassified Hahella]|uniref:phage tail protein n=1 Tax=unclassified Hahella TaxID=2624107 RepID=UPI001C1F165B|nr:MULTISPECIES: tail fiber protein [unclassified Hahella]MBU6952765.1 tail fiber protein [Hahella sp. HN01]MDG9670284.1 tail fiber protein [Hahella sp. CR1]
MEPYLGQISMMAFNFPPKDWAFCNGALQTISQNPALYSLFGTAFGGNGNTTFALPDLRGRAPIQIDPQNGINMGAQGGFETVTLIQDQMPIHSHQVYASSLDADKGSPRDNRILAATPDIYRPLTLPVSMSPNAISATGGGQAHQNMQPSLTINFCVALKGEYPQRN